MTLRCKPGDLARIAYPPPAGSDLRDRFVTVVTSFPGGTHGRPCWTIDRRIDFVMTGNATCPNGDRYIGEPVYLEAVEDAWLVPIRGDALAYDLEGVAHA
jgi:hypothetical protein